MIDWTFELFFPPDLNYFDLKKTQKMARIHLEPGDEVFHQGERGKAFYIVEDGVLEATRCHADGHILWKDELVRGDHFGEGSLLHGLVRRVTVTAKAPTTLVVFASKEFEVFVGLFQSLGQLLNYSATRGPLEEVLKPAIWSEELLNSPVGNLRNTAIACISDSATIAEAVQKLAEISQGFLLVVDRAGKLTGLVTGTDLHRASANRLKFSETVKSVASSEVVALQTHQVIRDALRIFYMKKVKQAPVLNAEGRPVGILRYLDVALARIQGAGGSHPGKG